MDNKNKKTKNMSIVYAVVGLFIIIGIVFAANLFDIDKKTGNKNIDMDDSLLATTKPEDNSSESEDKAPDNNNTESDPDEDYRGEILVGAKAKFLDFHNEDYLLALKSDKLYY